jgi:NAD(P)-dependent dehydrogenase (short-subunit alcohol dehydrogenase family)
MKNTETRTILITGGTSGIGMATAQKMVDEGHHVYILGRNPEACEYLVNGWKKANPAKEYGYFICDLLSQKSILRAADEILKRLDKIDVLINNAGGVFASRELTDEGFEKTFALNHLAYYTLTAALLPLLKKGRKSRIVCVSSNSHLQGKLEWDNLQGERKYFIMSQYSNTKLMNVLFTKALAEKLLPPGITVNALHPGVVKTNIGGKSNHAFFGVAWKVFSMLAGVSVEQGAQTSCYLATSEKVEGVTGKYFSNCEESKINPLADSMENVHRLWEITEKLTGISYSF